MNRFLSAAIAVAALSIQALPAAAAPYAIKDDSPTADADFTSACGGLDNFGCEYAVAEGRAGNRSTTGTWEAGFFNRLTDTQTNTTTAGWPAGLVSPFTLSYDADGGMAGTGRLHFNAIGSMMIGMNIDLSTPVAGDNPTGPASSLAIRSRNADLTDLILNGTALGLATTGSGAMAPAVVVEYIYVGGIDFTADWILTGTVRLNAAGNNSATAFQVKITDLPPPSPVSLPAALPLLAGAFAMVGGLRVLRKRA
jgi:hypothetical protein